jgi:small GTP-binding protein
MVKNVKLKMILLGDAYSGKTSIMNRYFNNVFEHDSKSTIGVDFFKTTIEKNGTQYSFFIWDTSGQDKFNSIIKSYYRNMTVAILVFDLSNKESIYNIQNWLNSINTYCHKDIIIHLVGNKCDKDITIDYDFMNELCRTNDIKFSEVSAKNNVNINRLIDTIITNIDTQITTSILKPNKYNGLTILESFNINVPIEEKKNCCTIL